MGKTTLPEDTLTAHDLSPAFVGQSGLPSNADALAYDPVQRLLAVATKDGRLLVFGREGVEQTLPSPSAVATAALFFLPAKDSLLRITTDGDVQLWSLTLAAMVDSVPCGDSVLCAAAVDRSPWVLAGTEGGSMLCLSVTTASGQLLEGAGNAGAVNMLPTEVGPDQLLGQGRLTGLDCLTRHNSHRVLLVHEGSGARVWDLRHKCLVTSTPAAAEGSSEQAGSVTCACWAGRGGDRFATGHSTGAVCLWAVPKPVQGDTEISTSLPATLTATLRPSGQDPSSQAAPVLRLLFLQPSGSSEQPALLALAGQPGSSGSDLWAFTSLELLRRACADAGNHIRFVWPGSSHGKQATPAEESIQQLPCFGAIQGIAPAPPLSDSQGHQTESVLVLSEGVQLVAYDAATWQPVPLSLPWQGLEAPLCTLSCGPGGELSAAALTEASRGSSSKADPSRSPAGRWDMLFSGGVPAASSAASSPSYGRRHSAQDSLLLSGHPDGRVRAWDVGAATPKLLGTVPFNSGGAGAKLRKVTAMQVDSASGLLAVAHDAAELRLYEFCRSEREVGVAVLGTTPGSHRQPAAEDLPARQPAGFQLFLRCQGSTAAAGSAEITALALAPKARLLAFGCANGELSILDLSQPAVLVRRWAYKGPLHQLHYVLAAQHAQSGSADSLALLASSGDCAAAVLNAHTGVAAEERREGWVRPRSDDEALDFAPLDASGCPVAAPSGPVSFPWAVGLSGGASALISSPGQLVKSRAHGSGGASDAGHLRVPGSTTDDNSDSESDEESVSGRVAGRSVSEASEDADDMLARAAAAKEMHLHLQEREQPDSRKKGLKGRLRLDKMAPEALKKSAGGQALTKMGRGMKSLARPSEHAHQEAGTDSKPEKAPGLLRNFSISRGGPRSPERGSPMGKLLGRNANASQLQDSSMSPPVPDFKARSSGGSESQMSSVAEDSVCTMALLAGSKSLRLYSLEGLREGSRKPLRKQLLEYAIVHAGVLVTLQGPGLAVITSEGFLAVLTVPGLEPLMASHLTPILGFPFSWAPEPAATMKLQQATSVSQSGDVTLVSAPGVLTRVSLSGDEGPRWPQSLWDEDKASAAHAAAMAAAEHETVPESEAPEAGQGGRLSGFFSQVRDSARHALEGSPKEPPSLREVLTGRPDQEEASSAAPQGGLRDPRGLLKAMGMKTREVSKDSGGEQLSRRTSVRAGGGAPLGARSGSFGGAALESRKFSIRPGSRAAMPAAMPAISDQPSLELASDSYPSAPDPISIDPQRAALLRGVAAQQAPQPPPSVSIDPQRAALLRGVYGDRGPPAPPAGPTQLPKTSQDPMRAQLFASMSNSQAQAGRPPGVRTAEEIKSQYRSGSVAPKVGSDLNNVMADNMVKLNQRTERLKSLQVKGEDMSQSASDFAGLARQLRDQQANKKWYQR